jgi:hypothetical protein
MYVVLLFITVFGNVEAHSCRPSMLGEKGIAGITLSMTVIPCVQEVVQSLDETHRGASEIWS